MQTFLPYSDFRKSAKVLDKKRCWKQVVEASQIINTLEGKSFGWKNHPVVKMWEGYVPLLKYYYNIFLEHCILYHKIKTKMWYIDNIYSYGVKSNLLGNKLIDNEIPSWEINEPFWLGQEPFHRAMRARLIEKNRDFYLPLFPNDEGFNNGKYFWPDNKTLTFRVI